MGWLSFVISWLRESLACRVKLMAVIAVIIFFILVKFPVWLILNYHDVSLISQQQSNMWLKYFINNPQAHTKQLSQQKIRPIEKGMLK
jgi:hypothetical protein